MILKLRKEPFELRKRRLLKPRMRFSAEEESYSISLAKGYEGELRFDQLEERYSKEWIVLRDLLFEVNHSLFQIDTLIIFPDLIYVFDIKNFNEDYIIEGDKWLAGNSRREVKNPLHQLQRCETLFRRLLQEIGFSIGIRPFMMFVNPDFFLYQAPLNQPFVFPSQLIRFMNQLSLKSVKLQKRHFQLAEQLISLHIDKYPNPRAMTYSYEHLKKGPTCEKCGSLVSVSGEKLAVCPQCGHIEVLKSVLMRNVEDYAFLFPERKITTNDIFEWSGGQIVKKTIQKTLSKNLTSVSHGMHRYYIFES